MYTILSLVIIIVSIILVIMVLLQSSKGGGLAGGITGGSAGNMGQMFGTRRTADFLSKATWWLGGIVLGLAIIINLFFLPGQTTNEQRESIIQSSSAVPTVPTTPVLPEQTTTDDNQGNGSTEEPKPEEN